MRPQLDWRKSESKNVCRATFLSYYLRSSEQIRHASLHITPGVGPENELEFLSNNHPGEIHVYEKDRETYAVLQSKVAALNEFFDTKKHANQISLHYGNAYQLLSFYGEKMLGSVWLDTCGFVGPQEAKQLNRIIKNIMPGGVFAITTTRDNYRGWKNSKYSKVSFQPDSKVEIHYGWDSPMTFFCGRKR